MNLGQVGPPKGGVGTESFLCKLPKATHCCCALARGGVNTGLLPAGLPWQVSLEASKIHPMPLDWQINIKPSRRAEVFSAGWLMYYHISTGSRHISPIMWFLDASVISCNAKLQQSVSQSVRVFSSTLTSNTDRWPLTFDYWPLTTDYWLLTTDYWLLTTDNWLLTTDYWLLTTDFWLLTTDYWLLTTDYWLLTTD